MENMAETKQQFIKRKYKFWLSVLNDGTEFSDSESDKRIAMSQALIEWGEREQ
jgi:hypothetical protein